MKTYFFIKYIVAGLLISLFFGSLSGLFILYSLRLGSSFPIYPLQKEVHGLYQLFGFTYFLVLGIAYQALPKFLGSSLKPTWAVQTSFFSLLFTAIFWLIPLIGTERFGMGSWNPYFHTFAGLGLLVTTFLFALVFYHLREGAQSKNQTYLHYLSAGTLGWVLSALFYLSTPHFAQELVYSTTLYGAILPWTLGMTLRAARMFMGLEEVHEKEVRLSFYFWGLGTVFVILALMLQTYTSVDILSTQKYYLEWLGFDFILVGIFIFIKGAKLFKKPKFTPSAAPIPFPLLIKTSYSFLILFCALNLLWQWNSYSLGISERGWFQDGTRHAFAGGYLMILMIAMLGRVLPVFLSQALIFPKCITLAAVFAALGALLRQSELIYTAFPHRAWLHLTACSGIFLYLAILLTSVSILATITKVQLQQK